MKYKGMDDSNLPDKVKKLGDEDRAQWVEVNNAALDDCDDDSGCDESAAAQAWGVVNEKGKKENSRLKFLSDFFSNVFRMMKPITPTASVEELKQRAVAIGNVYQQIASTIYEKYDYAWINDIYYENSQLFVIVAERGKLYRASISVENDQVTLGEFQEVAIQFTPVEQRQRAFNVRQQSDGKYRWFSVSCSAVLNRVGEIDTRDLFDSFVTHFEAHPEEQPIRVFYHQGETFRTGVCDFLARDGNLLITSGVYDDSELAKAEIAARSKAPDHWGDSIGYEPTQDPEMLEVADGVNIPMYRAGILREISTLPEADAAAWFTVTTPQEVKRMLKGKTLAAFVELFGGDEEAATQWLEDNAETRNRQITEEGLLTRDGTGTTDGANSQQAQRSDAAVADQQVVLDEAALSAIVNQVLNSEQLSTVVSTVGDLAARFSTLEAGLTRTSADQEERGRRVESRLAVLEGAEQERAAARSKDLPERSTINVTYRPRNQAATDDGSLTPEEKGKAALGKIPVMY